MRVLMGSLVGLIVGGGIGFLIPYGMYVVAGSDPENGGTLRGVAALVGIITISGGTVLGGIVGAVVGAATRPRNAVPSSTSRVLQPEPANVSKPVNLIQLLAAWIWILYGGFTLALYSLGTLLDIARGELANRALEVTILFASSALCLYAGAKCLRSSARDMLFYGIASILIGVALVLLSILPDLSAVIMVCAGTLLLISYAVERLKSATSTPRG